MTIIHPLANKSLKKKGGISRKALEIMSDFEGEIKETDIDLDFYRKHFLSMLRMLDSENFKDIIVSLHFFKSYVLLAKNRDLVEYFLKYTGSLGQIIELFLYHEVPLVVEEALDLLLCIYIYVPIDFNPQVLEEIAEKCVCLFSDGTYSLNILLLDFIYHVCQRNKSFCHLIIENDAFYKSSDFLLGDCDNPKKLIKKECRTFDILLDEIFNEDIIPYVILKICIFLDYRYQFSRFAGLSMLEKMLGYGLNLADYPDIIDNFIELTAAPKKVLLQLIKTIMKIQDKEIITHLITNKDFRNNLSIQCLYMLKGSKVRAKIYKLFTKFINFYQPNVDDIIVLAGIQGTVSSYIEKKNIFNYFVKLCESHDFAINFGFAGALTALAFCMSDSSDDIIEKIFNILGLIGHAFYVRGKDLRQVQDYDIIAQALSELNGSDDNDINHEMITELQKFYYNEDDDQSDY